MPFRPIGNPTQWKPLTAAAPLCPRVLAWHLIMPSGEASIPFTWKALYPIRKSKLSSAPFRDERLLISGTYGIIWVGEKPPIERVPSDRKRLLPKRNPFTDLGCDLESVIGDIRHDGFRCTEGLRHHQGYQSDWPCPQYRHGLTRLQRHAAGKHKHKNKASQERNETKVDTS